MILLKTFVTNIFRVVVIGGNNFYICTNKTIINGKKRRYR